MVGHDYAAMVVHKLVRKHRDMVMRAAILNPITPGFESRYLSPAHFPESWYSQFHQLDMGVELVSSSREACSTYFRHFLNHWSHDRQLFAGDELEVYVDTFLQPVEDCGHFVMREQPECVNRRLAEVFSA